MNKANDFLIWICITFLTLSSWMQISFTHNLQQHIWMLESAAEIEQNVEGSKIWRGPNDFAWIMDGTK